MVVRQIQSEKASHRISVSHLYRRFDVGCVLQGKYREVLGHVLRVRRASSKHFFNPWTSIEQIICECSSHRDGQVLLSDWQPLLTTIFRWSQGYHRLLRLRTTGCASLYQRFMDHNRLTVIDDISCILHLDSSLYQMNKEVDTGTLIEPFEGLEGFKFTLWTIWRSCQKVETTRRTSNGQQCY